MEALIRFEGATFAWLRPDAPEEAALRTRDDLEIVFEDFSVELPAGMVSVLGPNGVGKSTFLLLAGGRIFPLGGAVSVGGEDTRAYLNALHDPAVEEARNRLVSFVYQNMEFETDETLGEILAAMDKGADEFRRMLLAEGVLALDLGEALGKRPQEMAKGELQRAVIALALHYGSPVVVMDEPVFALEEDRKAAVFAWLRRYATATDTTIVYSAHDLELCRAHADWSLLLWREGGELRHLVGPAREVCTEANLEKAYRAPMATLKQKDRLYRQMLNDKLQGGTAHNKGSTR